MQFTALFFAISEGHSEVVEYIVGTGRVDLSHRTKVIRSDHIQTIYKFGHFFGGA